MYKIRSLYRHLVGYGAVSGRYVPPPPPLPGAPAAAGGMYLSEVPRSLRGIADVSEICCDVCD